MKFHIMKSCIIDKNPKLGQSDPNYITMTCGSFWKAMQGAYREGDKNGRKELKEAYERLKKLNPKGKDPMSDFLDSLGM